MKDLIQEFALEENVSLASYVWFKTGGNAKYFYRCHSIEELQKFMQQKPHELDVMPIGVGSNMLVRDGGVNAVALRLGKGFNILECKDNCQIFVGACVPDMLFAKFAADNNIAGFEFMRGVPGTIGGALKMNAGAYDKEIKDILIEAYGIDKLGNYKILKLKDLNMTYRHTIIEEGFIFTGALFQGIEGNKEDILAKMNDITSSREASQPVKEKTGGSTFKNPVGRKAWQLIDEAGCRGLKIGGAMMSEKHCNFMININDATGHDLETLGETVRKRVYEKSGILLEWEIKRVGEYKMPVEVFNAA